MGDDKETDPWMQLAYWDELNVQRWQNIDWQWIRRCAGRYSKRLEVFIVPALAVFIIVSAWVSRSVDLPCSLLAKHRPLACSLPLLRTYDHGWGSA